ncbi:MAG: hypothetical protein ACRD7E_10390 [Bryobacteraceae bacterium]
MIISLLDCDDLDIADNAVLGAGVQHFLGFIDAADAGTGKLAPGVAG